MLKAKLLGATAGAEAALAIEDVFSTYLYTGNGSTQTITNGIDLAGQGGLVWIKRRNAADNNMLSDTVRGFGNFLQSNSSFQNQNLTSLFSTSVSGTGFSFTTSNTVLNASGSTYASWTFRQAPRFFDVVTYTGTGANRTIAHDLGVVPGCIIVKRTDTTGDWQVYHRSNTAAPETDHLVLNSTAATVDDNTRWNDTLPTSTVFSLGTNATVNASGGTYVAYLFAHDPLGPSGDGSDGLIACGSYTNVSNAGSVELGWEPQFILHKSVGVGNWEINDNMRGLTVAGTVEARLFPNSSSAESTTNLFNIRPTGFDSQQATGTYIYIAIRRGPMREPTVGTEVFSANTSSAATGTKITTGFPVDMQILAYRSGTAGKQVVDRMRGVSTNTTGSGQTLYTTSTAAEAADAGSSQYWDNTGFQMPSNWGGISDVFWNFRRAPGFFDVVAYTGTGANRTISHNLGAAPELMIVKKRSAVDNWIVYAGDATDYLILNTTAATADLDTMWNDTAPTGSVFSLGTNDDVNGNTATFIAYLFATLPGISKVGSYTGNGSSQTINCGFTTGARFILIKRTDATGNWHVWDTDRGIVAANDPYLLLNSTAAEVTTNDSVDPDTSGFIVNQNATTNINVSSATYIFYAIA